MAASRGTKIFFWIAVAVFTAFCVLFYMLKSGYGIPEFMVKRIYDPPRTEQPMGAYTRAFEKRKAFVRSGAVSLDMTYYMFSPEKPWPPHVKFPLVIVLHGAPGNAYAAQYLVQRSLRYDYPAFVMVPVLPKALRWYNYGSMPNGSLADRKSAVGLPGAMNIAQQMMDTYPIDRSRVYVIGCSEGGAGAFGAAKDYADTIAASVAISGGWPASDADDFMRTPMFVMHGARDTVVPPHYSRLIAAEVKKMGGPMQYLEIPNMAHDCPSATLYGRPVWKWLFAQRNADAVNAE